MTFWGQGMPLRYDLLRQWLPIGISLLSLVLAGIALSWNVYRDVILKARVRVHFSIVTVMSEGPGQRLVGSGQLLSIGVTNHGPGSVRIELRTLRGFALAAAPATTSLLRDSEIRPN